MIKVNAPSLEYFAKFHLTTLESKELSLAATELMQAITAAHQNTKPSLHFSI